MIATPQYTEKSQDYLSQVRSWLSTYIKGSTPCFLTGTQAFGNATSDSDIDIVCSIEHKKSILKAVNTWAVAEGDLFSQKKVKESEYFSAIKVNILPKSPSVNFIFQHPVDFVAWFRAMLVIQQVYPDVIHDKRTRHATHQHLVATFRSSTASMPEINTKNYLDWCGNFFK